MLERIRTRVNSRGIFDITRIVSAGSIAEATFILKFREEEIFLEFDYLAVLKESIRQCKDQTAENTCRGCIQTINPPVEFSRVRHFCKGLFCPFRGGKIEFDAETFKNKGAINHLFMDR